MEGDLKLLTGRARVGESVKKTFARGAMAARQVLTLKIEVRVLAGEPLRTPFSMAHRVVARV
jgi:hypothetical protein